MTLRRSAIPISMVYRCYASNSSSNQGQTSTSVDPRNLARFDELSTTASEWMNEKTGAFRALHSFNKLRVPWIAGQLTKNKSVDKPLEGVRIVDVGSGGGLLSMALCRLGADVTGVDASTSTKRVAELTAQRTLKPEQLARLRFVNSTVESFAAENTGGFDAVVASEILEHVSDLPGFVHQCVCLAKTGLRAPLFFTTINKTLLSRIFAVWMAENVLSIVPRGVHDWNNFVEPSELRQTLLGENCRYVGKPIGISYNPITNDWSWSAFHPMNYALIAIKN